LPLACTVLLSDGTQVDFYVFSAASGYELNNEKIKKLLCEKTNAKPDYVPNFSWDYFFRNFQYHINGTIVPELFIDSSRTQGFLYDFLNTYKAIAIVFTSTVTVQPESLYSNILVYDHPIPFIQHTGYWIPHAMPILFLLLFVFCSKIRISIWDYVEAFRNRAISAVPISLSLLAIGLFIISYFSYQFEAYLWATLPIFLVQQFCFI